MTKKRFIYDGLYVRDILNKIPSILTHNDNQRDEFLNGLNNLSEENEWLKQELKIYRKIASCSNCKYQNYDWFEDGDEFEICERGNNEQQIEYHVCEEWREL